ncbi:GntR family transcriptional regulator [Streptomyces sp. NPDC020807]|uniref:GntR family transcriptional regulator n=1 Tax=Streptomyces sp. NPDC020807 TaxID=3155119 RepID=UPI0033FF6B86
MTSEKPSLPATIKALRSLVAGQEPGAALASEADLAETLGSSRALVNKAVAHLMAEGVLIRRGKKAVVQPIPVILRQVPTRYTTRFREAHGARGAFDAEIKQHGLQPRWTTVPGEQEAPASVAKLLDVEPGSTVVTRSREMFADDVPVQIAVTYLPQDVASSAGASQTDTGTGGIISRLSESNSQQKSVTETIRTRTPDEHEQEVLRLPSDSRVYELTHVARTAQGRTVEVTVHVMPVHLWDLSYSWDLD